MQHNMPDRLSVTERYLTITHMFPSHKCKTNKVNKILQHFVYTQHRVKPDKPL